MAPLHHPRPNCSGCSVERTGSRMKNLVAGLFLGVLACFSPFLLKAQQAGPITLIPDKTDIKFSYTDYFGDPAGIALSPKVAQTELVARGPLFITNSNYQTHWTYLLYPGERLEFQNDSLVLKQTPHDPATRVNELYFFKYLQTRYGPLNPAYPTSASERELSEDTERYLAYLEEYAAARTISPTFKLYAQDFFRSRLYAYKIGVSLRYPTAAGTEKILADAGKFYRPDLDPQNPQSRRFLIYYLQLLTSAYTARNPAASTENAEKAVIDEHFSQPIRDFFYLSRLKKAYLGDKPTVFSPGEIRNAAYLNYLDELHSTVSSTRANEIILVSQNTGTSTFAAAMKAQGKKLVFIDFWASWCEPCIIGIPGTRALAAQLKNSGIGFAFVSVDENKAAWLNSAKTLGLGADKNSWLLQGNFQSPLAKRLRLKAIPRYILVDANGKIVSADAPGPDYAGIKAFLQKEYAKASVTRP